MVFTGLLTVTNEKGEIRICALVATKSHSQFELALKKMKNSLDVFGHTQPRVFYTDNVTADKPFLEASFPSLKEAVVPVEKYAHLEPIVLPADVVLTVRDTSSGIEDAVRTIMDDLASDGTGTLVVGFDSEWNVNVSPSGRIIGRGQTAVIQIAYKNCVFIFKVGQYVSPLNAN